MGGLVERRLSETLWKVMPVLTRTLLIVSASSLCRQKSAFDYLHIRSVRVASVRYQYHLFFPQLESALLYAYKKNVADIQ